MTRCDGYSPCQTPTPTVGPTPSPQLPLTGVETGQALGFLGVYLFAAGLLLIWVARRWGREKEDLHL